MLIQYLLPLCVNTAEFHNKKITHCVESTLTCMLVVLTIGLLKYAKYMYFYTHNPFTIIINNTIMHQRVKLLYWYTLDLSKLDGYNLAVQPLDIYGIFYVALEPCQFMLN